MKKKIILLVCIGILFLGGIIFTIEKENKKVMKSDFENENTISLLENNEKDNNVIEVTEDEKIEENVIVTEEIEKNNKEQIIQDNAEVIKKEDIQKSEVKPKDENTTKPTSELEIKQEITAEIKEEPKEEIIEQPKQEPIQKEPEIPVTNTEEYRYNSEMTQKIISIINNNPSDYMNQYGFNIVEDKSIITLTNQFTFSEERVKNKVKNKFGTIKVYAQDYYLNNTYISTECFIY